MNPNNHLWWPTLASTTGATIAVAVHHVFRLGPELIPPGLVLVVLPIAMLIVIRRRGSVGLSIAFAALVSLIFVWFGVVDGVLDHVLKALGLENHTILPGGEADMVMTYFSLGNPASSATFYEGTGIVEAVSSVVMIGFTVAFLGSGVAHRRQKAAAAMVV